MSALYEESHRQLDTQRLAARIEQRPLDAEARFVVVLNVREALPNCPRYLHKYALVERSKFVPHGDPARSES